MEEIVKLIGEHGLLIVIAGLFIWDWLVNKKNNAETLKELKDSNKNIATSSQNIAKSLDIILNNQIREENSLNNIVEKIDRNYEELRRK